MSRNVSVERKWHEQRTVRVEEALVGVDESDVHVSTGAPEQLVEVARALLTPLETRDLRPRRQQLHQLHTQAPGRSRECTGVNSKETPRPLGEHKWRSAQLFER